MKTNRTRTHGDPISSTALRSLVLGAFVLGALPACGGSLPRTAPPPEYERYELPAWEAPTEPGAADPLASDSTSGATSGSGGPEIAPIPEPPAAAEGPAPGPEPSEPPSLAPELPAKSPESGAAP